MSKSTLIAQILTLLLDSQGADASVLKEVFPEEFTPGVHRQSRDGDRSQWRDASADLEDSIRFLVERNLVAFTPDGRVVSTTAHEGDSTFADREEDFGMKHEIEWDYVAGLPLEHCDPFAFECPRFDE